MRKRCVLVIVMLFGAVAFANTASFYEVPTQQESLRTYARFAIQDLEVNQDGSSVELRYTLPTELTGDPVHVQLSGEIRESGEWRLRGKHGRARCQKDVCEIEYRNLPINPVALNERLKAVSHSGFELQARLQVAAEFGGNPIGFLHLK